MPLYESTFIARHDISAQQVEALAGSFTEVVKENGGEVVKTEFWGLKTLAYRIKKNRKGHYVHFNLNSPSAAVHELERNMRLNEDVLRYLTVRVEELDPEPSVMMQVRAARDDRARRGGGPPRPRSEEPAKADSEKPAKAGSEEPAKADSEEPAKPESEAAAGNGDATEAPEKAGKDSGDDE